MVSRDEPLARRANNRCHAFRDDALGEDDAVGLTERIRSGDVSASELVDAAITRAEAGEPG